MTEYTGTYTASDKLRDEIKSRLELDSKEMTDDEKTQRMNEAYDRLTDILASLAVDGLSKTLGFNTSKIASDEATFAQRQVK